MTDQTATEAPERTLTTSQVLARYDAKMRAAATAAGGPTNRTACAGLILSGDLDSVVYTGTDSMIYALSMREDTPPVKVSATVLRSLLTDAYDLADPQVDHHNAFVFADTETLRRVTKMAERWGRESGTQEARATSRLMAFRKTLPVSTFTPVLTEALATRYWLPSGGQVDDLGAWDVAFGHGKPYASREAFSYLLGRALDGGTDKEIVDTIGRAEKYAARSAQHGSDHAQCSAFTKAGTITDAYDALLSLDPTLRERNVLSGAVSKIRIHQLKADKVEAYLDDPGKIREGSKILIFDGYEYGKKVELTLKSVEFHNDTLMAVLSAPRSTTKNGYLIEEAKKNYRPLFAAPAPFLMVKKSPKNRRWTTGDEDRKLHVDIPLDIALAGGPVGD